MKPTDQNSNIISMPHWQLEHLSQLETFLDSSTPTPSTFHDPLYAKIAKVRARAIDRACLVEGMIELDYDSQLQLADGGKVIQNIS